MVKYTQSPRASWSETRNFKQCKKWFVPQIKTTLCLERTFYVAGLKLEKSMENIFLVVIPGGLPFKVEVVLKSGWMKSVLCLLGFCELRIVESREGIRMQAAALTWNKKAWDRNKKPWDRPCPESDLAGAPKQISAGQERKQTSGANYSPVSPRHCLNRNLALDIITLDIPWAAFSEESTCDAIPWPLW